MTFFNVTNLHPLDEQALLLRRAGLTHLVRNPSADEVQALADAGDQLVMEAVAALVKALANPPAVLKRFDGGMAARAQTKELAYQLSRGG